MKCVIKITRIIHRSVTELKQLIDKWIEKLSLKQYCQLIQIRKQSKLASLQDMERPLKDRTNSHFLLFSSALS